MTINTLHEPLSTWKTWTTSTLRQMLREGKVSIDRLTQLKEEWLSERQIIDIVRERVKDITN